MIYIKQVNIDHIDISQPTDINEARKIDYMQSVVLSYEKIRAHYTVSTV